jgi:hypothetical protein
MMATKGGVNLSSIGAEGSTSRKIEPDGGQGFSMAWAMACSSLNRKISFFPSLNALAMGEQNDA